MDQALTALRSLGRVSDESQSGEDVTDQMIDLDARLTNARNTEKRLTEVLKNRTGDLADVLAVEREVARVREEIERLDAQRKTLEQRVSFATVTLTVTEERQAQLDTGGVPVHCQLRNAFVEGLQAAYESALSVAIGLLRCLRSSCSGPSCCGGRRGGRIERCAQSGRRRRRAETACYFVVMLAVASTSVAAADIES